MDTEEWTIEQEKNRLLKKLKTLDPQSEEYEQAVTNYQRLTSAGNEKNQSAISPDVIATAVTNILGILIILNYERFNVISSRAIGFVFRR